MRNQRIPNPRASQEGRPSWAAPPGRRPPILTRLPGGGFPWKKIIVYGLVVFFLANFLLTAGVLALFLFQRDDIRVALETQRRSLYGEGSLAPPPPIRIYSGNGSLIGEYLPVRRSQMTMNRCNQMRWLSRATVASEDRDFYNHPGVSLRGILRAMVNNLLAFSVREGGGTITQQLARNLFTSRGAPALPRKIFETFAAFQVESQLNKKEILCLYLNKIYMGEGRVGAEEASRFYFNKPPERLSPAEAAMIVGLYPAPVYYSPLNSIGLSLKKQSLALDALVREKWLDDKSKARLLEKFKKKYHIPRGAEPDSGIIGLYGASRDFRRNAAPAANEYVRQFIFEILPEEMIRGGGLSVYTTIDYLRQRSAESSIRTGIRGIKWLVREKGKLPPGKIDTLYRRLNGVFVAINPRNGDIRAVVGGFRTAEGGVMTHRAWKMKRQTGSAIKGFLYATALEKGVLKPGDQVVDEKINFNGYSPENWYHEYLGAISLRKAVALSVNTIAVKTLHSVGTSTFREKLASALRLDFFEARQRFPDQLSLALGSAEMTPLELLRLYSVLLNNGKPITPRLVRRIESVTGAVIWEAPPALENPDPVFSPETCGAAIDLLKGIFDERYEGTMKRFGRRRLEKFGYLPFPVAGKSGTVQTVPLIRRKYPGVRGVHDAWFVGLVPDEAAVIWFGHDEGVPFPGSGSGTAGSAWVRYAQNALPGNVHGDFPKSESSPVDSPVDSTAPDASPEEKRPSAEETAPTETPTTL